MPGILPLACAREVASNLRAQADNESCPAETLYQLAGACFNGAIMKRDIALGLNHFRRAAEAGHEQAIGSLYNVFPGCGSSPPDDLLEACHSFLDRHGPSSIVFANIDIFGHPESLEINNYRIFGKNWIQHCQNNGRREQVFKATSLERRTAVLRLIKGASDGRSEVCQHLAFDSSKLPSYSGVNEYIPLSSFRIGNFKKNLNNCGCLERPNTFGFTLLQEAVSHGDHAMVDFLIDEAKAKVDNYGNTPGWTPLWLACYSGQFSLVLKLIRRGAQITCHDQQTGFTILHLLSQFSNSDDIENLLRTLLQTDDGSTMLEKLSTHGLTPLHASFMGWDYSDGAATRALLRHGANPFRPLRDIENEVTPFSLCATMLDSALLEEMIGCPYLANRVSAPGTHKEVSKAKALAYIYLSREHTEFFFLSSLGKGWESSLNYTLRLLVDDEMQVEFVNLVGEGKQNDLLRDATAFCRSYIARSLVDADIVSIGTYTDRPPLHFALERRLEDVVFSLIEKGAKVTQEDHYGNPTALHTAARYFPEVLEKLIQKVESMDTSQHEHMTVKHILRIRDANGFDVLSLLLAEGSNDQLDLVERLQRSYELDLDAIAVDMGSDKSTLAGAIITMCTTSGLIPLAQLGYLLKLRPLPKFICTESGKTLLSLAVAGPLACTCSASILTAPDAKL